MSVQFATIPDNIREPIVATEFDATGAVDSITPYRTLIIGRGAVAGNNDMLKRVVSIGQIQALYGNSQLGDMLRQFFMNNATGEVYAISLAQSGGASASGTITVSGTATEAKSFQVYIAGRRVAFSVENADTAAEVATKIANAVNAITRIPVTASASSGEVTLTARQEGLHGNGYDLRISYTDLEESTVAGLTFALTDFSGGSGDIDYSTAVSTMDDVHYQAIIVESSAKATLQPLINHIDNLYGGLLQRDAIIYTAVDGTFTANGTLANSYNVKEVSILPMTSSPTPAYEIAAAYGAVAAFELSNDPARPLKEVSLTGVLSPRVEDQYSYTERNTLLSQGGSTFTSQQSTIFLSKAITTSRTDSQGNVNEAYSSINSIASLSFIRTDWNNNIRTKYPRAKLASDNISERRLPQGQQFMTPSVYRSELYTRALFWQDQGIIESADTFIKSVIVQRDLGNPNRLNAVIRPDLVNQLEIVATKIQFIL